MAQAEPPKNEITIEEFFDTVLTQAITERTSDIHIEPLVKEMSIRFRIDGILQEKGLWPLYDLEPLTTRIKALSNLDITTHVGPQDGHFEFLYKPNLQAAHEEETLRGKEGRSDPLSRLFGRIPGAEEEKPNPQLRAQAETVSGAQHARLFDIRVSIFPTVKGEAVVLRLLNREEMLISLKDLGLDDKEYSALKRLITRPYGMVLVTGPAGSGKTTTLYSILIELKSKERNIITLEDPVELSIENIRQVQVNPTQGFDFATGIRSILRQDPDGMMIGEIRDHETAENAIRSSLSGRIVFSTIHANTVAGTIARLMDMNIDRSLIAYALNGVISQRLVRKICQNCRVPYVPSPEYLKYFDIDSTVVHRFMKGEGCAKCSKTGFYGRVGIFELFEFDNQLRALIVERSPMSALQAYIEGAGMKTLKQDAREKVLAGLTTLEEAARAV